MDKLIPFHEAVPRMGIAMQTGRNWLTQGKFPIPTFKIGRLRFIRESDLEAYFQGLVSDTISNPAETPLKVEPNSGTTFSFELSPRKRGRPRKQAAV